MTPQRYKKLGGSSGGEETASSDPDMGELEAMAQAAIELSGDTFWSILKAKTLKALKSGL